MVERLTRGPATVSELAAPFAMSLPAVLQHLRMLEASGLVLSEKVGRVAERRAIWERRLDRLGELLAAPAHTQETGTPP